MQRLTGMLIVLWILVVLNVAFLVGLFHGVAAYFTLDELTNWQVVTQNVGSRQTEYYLHLDKRYDDHPVERTLTCGVSAASSFSLGFVGAILMLIFLPHWRERVRLAVIVVWAVIPVVITGLAFREEAKWGNAPELVNWALPYLVAYGGCYLAGGLLALWIGRGLVRLLVRICVPPRWRVYLEAINPADRDPA
jgi:hypothetical protein